MADRDMGTSDHNISTEHQKEGDARLPSDALDRNQKPDSNDEDKKQIGRG